MSDIYIKLVLVKNTGTDPATRYACLAPVAYLDQQTQQEWRAVKVYAHHSAAEPKKQNIMDPLTACTCRTPTPEYIALPDNDATIGRLFRQSMQRRLL